MDRPVHADLPEDLILWDVVEEHLDEAAFLFGQWHRALDSHLYTLDSLAKGLESRLLAHVDGLVANGPAVAERLLVPLLRAPEEPSESRAAAASLALIGQERQDVVVSALLAADPVTSRGAEQALALAAPTTFDEWLPGALTRLLEPAQHAALLRIAAARGVCIPNLLSFLQSPHGEVASAAARAAMWSEPRLHAPVLEYLLDDSRGEVADAALETALIHGSRAAFKRCVARARDTARADGLAMLLTAMVGESAHHEVLTEHLARETHRAAALFALGYTGQAAVVPGLIEQLAAKEATTRKLAAEAIAAIAGFDPMADEFVMDEPLPALEELAPLEEDLEIELVPSEVDSLPEPNAGAIARWWREHGDQLDRHGRILLGKPWTYEHAERALGNLSMRRRKPVVVWLRVCSGGKSKIGVRGIVAR